MKLFSLPQEKVAYMDLLLSYGITKGTKPLQSKSYDFTYENVSFMVKCVLYHLRIHRLQVTQYKSVFLIVTSIQLQIYIFTQ